MEAHEIVRPRIGSDEQVVVHQERADAEVRGEQRGVVSTFDGVVDDPGRVGRSARKVA
jgi:hypothetical protein